MTDARNSMMAPHRQMGSIPPRRRRCNRLAGAALDGAVRVREPYWDCALVEFGTLPGVMIGTLFNAGGVR
jgi:hypothetical protein